MLHRHLIPLSVGLLLPFASAASDLPAAGYSLFDRLFSVAVDEAYEYDIPYPFERLVERLETRLFAGSNADEPLVAVLIPRGRSLQREAASPDYYRFPRIVMALDTESPLPLLVKNRLFLGYQEKAQSLEVISYNETAGRFEYQVVENYAAGKTPRVYYASRQLCLSCHQNEATIYAKPLWRESNFNNAVADRIAAYNYRYHGIVANAHKGNSGRFDQATDQASLMQTYQQVWQEGCAASSDERDNRACRGGLFLAVVQQALASMPRPKYRSPLIEQVLLPSLQRSWQQRWPDGIPVASADIDDRRAPQNDEVDVIPPALDPTSLRPALAHWTYRAAMVRAVQGIGDNFLLSRDLVRLNQLLVRQARVDAAMQSSHQGDCELELPRGLVAGEWINIDCLFRNPADGDIKVEGEFRLQQDPGARPESNRFLFSGRAGWARVVISGVFESAGSNRLRLRIDDSINPKIGRLWDNRRIAGFELSLPATIAANRIDAPAELTLVDDLGRIETAIHRLLEQADRGESTLFDPRPIQGAELMQALLRELGAIPSADGAGFDPKGLRREVADSDRRRQAEILDRLPADSPLQLVYRYCSACHVGTGLLPPGFLRGDLHQVEQQLRQCAPRIAYRLEMWRQDASLRPKSPMPPAHFLGTGDNLEWWRQSEELDTLRHYFQQLRGMARPAGLDAAYHQLPPCTGRFSGYAELD